MGVFERVRTLMASGVNDLVEGIEDPGRSLRRAVLECEGLFRELSLNAARSRRTGEYLAEEAGRARRRAGEWAARAEEAVSLGNDNLARAALGRRWQALDKADRLQAQREEVLREAGQVQAERLALRERLTELKRRHAALGGPVWREPEPPDEDTATGERVEEELRRLKRELAGGM